MWSIEVGGKEFGTSVTVLCENGMLVEALIDRIAAVSKRERSEFVYYGLQVPNNPGWLHGTISAEHTSLVLKRRYCMGICNIDTSDPIQALISFLQLRDEVLSGFLKLDVNDACTLAGLQARIELGSFSESKLEALSLSSCLPYNVMTSKIWIRAVCGNQPRDIVVSFLLCWRVLHCFSSSGGLGSVPRDVVGLIAHKIWVAQQECCWKKEVSISWRQVQMTEDAILRYVILVRKLPIHGMTLFDVQERLTREKKWTHVWLGVTCDAIMRLDYMSRQILKQWPLWQVRRWAASANMFTLDFGSYESEYYTVETSMGKEISQIISDYVDLLLHVHRDTSQLVDGECSE
jgi:hypothetical protein